MSEDQVDVAHVDQGIDGEGQYEDRLFDMNRINQQDERADYRHKPKGGRDIGFFLIFADNPLQDEPAAEYKLTGEGCGLPPGVELNLQNRVLN